ncbi:MAG: hypothetical protein MUC36_06800 [Planctomycetes bacterium]|nr:hypothetical protein [Planctomycetota bacterium]
MLTLPNPVVVGDIDDPIIWTIAAFAMWAEIKVVRSQLRRIRGIDSDLDNVLLLMNLWTWIAFLLAVEAWAGPGPDGVLRIAALELAVVAVEAVLLHALMRDRFLMKGLAVRRIRWAQAFRVSLVGNLVSIAVSLALPLAVVTVAIVLD